jgi:UDP-glucose 4-epimerase
MRVLVTGGAGFIGSHTVDALIAAGNEVAVLDNLSSGLEANVNPLARLFLADVTDLNAARQVVGDFAPDAIYHFAAQVSVPKSFEDPAEDAEVNILGVINLLSAGRDLAVLPRFVFASSGGAVYGNALELPCTEQTKPNPATPYGIAKLAAEMYVQLTARTYGFPFVVLRFANVYGPRQGSSKETGVCAIFTRQAVSNAPLTVMGDGSQTRDYVYVGDISAAALSALTAGSDDVLNLGSGVETSTAELAKIIIDVAGGSSGVSFLAERPGDVARACLSSDKAGRVLDWSAKHDLASGLAETVRWCRASLDTESGVHQPIG